MTVVLSVSGVGKVYRHYPHAWQRVATWFGAKARPHSEYWAVRGISFKVHEGESVGIIGLNGAGKSTLLKMVAGTVRPSEGTIEVSGPNAAILELGMGFSPEQSGRQNAVHSLGLMGHAPDTIRSGLPGVEEFAEVGEYFDRPVREYSSGMQMRVAFAVATAVRPSLLIIDEALSVGDAYFQHKSFARIKEFREKGTSLLFVSHDRSTVQAICDRAVLLNKGMLLRDGTPDEVVDYYNALLAEKENHSIRQEVVDGKVHTTSGSGEAIVRSAALFNAAEKQIEFVTVGQDVELRVTVDVLKDLPRLVLGYAIKDRLGQYIYGTNTHYTRQALENVRSGSVFQFRIRFAMNLGPGTYSVSTALVSTETHLVNNYDWRELALMFTVANTDKPIFVGTSWVPSTIDIGSI